MLEIKFIRENADKVKQSLNNRKVNFDLDEFLEIDTRRRELIQKIDELRANHKKVSAQVSQTIKEKSKDQSLIESSRALSGQISNLEKDLAVVLEDFETKLLYIPNIPHESVPVGSSAENSLIKTWSEPKKFDFKPLSHVELAELLGMIDFKAATKITGSNFVLFKGAGSRLERALINFMLDTHTANHGYTEVMPPLLVNRQSMTTTGQLPKLEEDMYKIACDDLFLIPTAEVPVTNMHRDDVIPDESLPVSYVTYTPCFRREAGSYGKDTRGLVRVHQFDKVEMVKFVRPIESYQELEKLLADACKILELLEIPYRVISLATGDLSFAAAKCYDIEIYSPGVDKWLEVSSCSNFEDFQARRGNIRYKDKETSKKLFVHTLNGSGVALARLVVAIMENYQLADGSILIPQVLRRYFDGRDKIQK